MGHRKRLNISLISIISIVTIFMSFNFKTVVAADADLSSKDQETVNAAPTGLLMSNYFTIKGPTNNSSDSSFRFKSNSAFISDNNKVLVLAHGTSTNSADNSGSIKNATGSYGSAWSNINTAYFDASKPQTISAWLSFGYGGGSETINGQGLALVLQNNSDGSTQMGAGQQGLGVYGFDKTSQSSLIGSDAVAKTAIQNSIALEFDTQHQEIRTDSPYPPIKYYSSGIFIPTDYYSMNGFDSKNTSISAPNGFPDNTSLGAGGPFGHIALTYPANPNTYYATNTQYGLTLDPSSTSYPFKQAYSMFHIHRREADLADDFKAIVEDQLTDEAYTEAITAISNKLVDFIVNNPYLMIKDSNVDSRDYDIDWLMPYDKKTGEVYDTEYPIYPNSNIALYVHYLLKDAKEFNII